MHGRENCTLIPVYIQCVLKKIYEATGDETLRSIAEQLISLERDASTPRIRHGVALCNSSGTGTKSSDLMNSYRPI